MTKPVTTTMLPQQSLPHKTQRRKNLVPFPRSFPLTPQHCANQPAEAIDKTAAINKPSPSPKQPEQSKETLPKPASNNKEVDMNSRTTLLNKGQRTQVPSSIN